MCYYANGRFGGILVPGTQEVSVGALERIFQVGCSYKPQALAMNTPRGCCARVMCTLPVARRRQVHVRVHARMRHHQSSTPPPDVRHIHFEL